MYIIAIGWLYVVLMMAVTEKNFIAGFMTFFWYGALPLALFLWLLGTPRHKRSRMAAKERIGKPDGGNAQAD